MSKQPFPKLYTGSKKLKALWEKMYPTIEVVLTEKLPVNNPKKRETK